jgi:predicted Zn-dependent protease
MKTSRNLVAVRGTDVAADPRVGRREGEAPAEPRLAGRLALPTAALLMLVLSACETPRPLRKPAAVWDQTRLSAMLQLADEQINAGKFDQARQTLATFHESTDPRLGVALARVDVEEGRYEAALNRLEGVLPEARSGSTYDRLRGVALEGLGRWADAAVAYEAAYRAEPVIELLLAWLDALVLDGRVDVAREMLEGERGRFPGQPVLQVLAARLCQQNGSLEAAVHELTAAEFAEPDSTEIRRRLAETYTAAGQYEAALPLWHALVKDHPEDDGARLGLAAASLGANKPAEALEAALQVLARHDDHVDARLLAALSYRRLGQPSAAAALLSDLRTDDETARLAREILASSK